MSARPVRRRISQLAAAVLVAGALGFCASCTTGTGTDAGAATSQESAGTDTHSAAPTGSPATSSGAPVEPSEQATSPEVKAVQGSQGVENSYGVSEAPRSSEPDATSQAKLAQQPQKQHKTAKLGAEVQVVPDVVVELGKIRAVTAEASLPGEIGGPAIQVPVSITNNTDADILTRDVVTDIFFGKDQLPGIPLISAENDQFPVNLAPGATATATYVVVLPDNAGTTVRVTVNYRAADPLAVFEGTWPGAAGVKK